MELKDAERWLKNYWQSDEIDAGETRRTAERFERVLGDPETFPNADLDTIDAFLDAAYSWLGGLSHNLEVEH